MYNTIINEEHLENNECFSNIILNIIDIYLYDNYSYIYESLKEKYKFHKILSEIFMSKNSNININIKYIDLLKIIIMKNDIIKNINGGNDTILFNKIFLFYIELDSYEDELSKIEIKGKIIHIFFTIFFIYNNKKIK